MPPEQDVKAHVLVREAAVLCGRDWFEGCIRALDPAARLTWHYKEGAAMGAETPVCQIETRTWDALREDLPTEVVLYTVSMDLPFAQARWRGARSRAGRQRRKR